ncbi:hypothetical protein BCR33DRAFT_764423 [Rhizoclosmatium globosum]|uniref:Uncharacterized protein n=1 Tax=Rhizoclosmatium globosum TaxID=329046 RepID=A0A1Y2CK98_9FUNG|nr:hypothetical protein BCR33DRAFT_764423 [Rhizoclosmatium globosum]|eukprot:ORY47416.1 hypothetical protein BCR33DRAFT_764423 [Rhizoclosmatium globosum]
MSSLISSHSLTTRRVVLAETKRSLEFRPNITYQDKAAVISTAVFATLSLIEAFAFTAFSIYIAHKKPNRDTSILKKACSKYNLLTLIMFLGTFVWFTCACYSISLFHNNLAAVVPQSIQTIAAATVETCFMHCLWAISKLIIRRSSSAYCFAVISTLVTYSPLIFYGQAIVYMIAGITKIPVMMTVNRIWTAIGAFAASFFCIYLMIMFTKYLMKQEKDLKESFQDQSDMQNNVLGDDAYKQQRKFKIIARHGIWASVFCVAAVTSFTLGLIEALADWVNIFQTLVYVWFDMSLLTLFLMKVRMDIRISKKSENSEKETGCEDQKVSEERKTAFAPSPISTRKVGRNSFVG